MVQNDFFREKICFEVIFEFLIYPMWGKKKNENATRPMVKICRQDQNLTYWSIYVKYLE